MSKHALDSCPRCGALFTCKANAIGQCQCQYIQLSRDETPDIREQTAIDYGDQCLCLACLTALKAEFAARPLGR